MDETSLNPTPVVCVYYWCCVLMCFCSSLGDTVQMEPIGLLPREENPMQCHQSGVTTFNCNNKLCVSSMIGFHVNLQVYSLISIWNMVWCQERCHWSQLKCILDASLVCFSSGHQPKHWELRDTWVLQNGWYRTQHICPLMICFHVLLQFALKTGVDGGDKSSATNLPSGVETFNCENDIECSIYVL